MTVTGLTDTMYAGNKRTMIFTILDADNGNVPLDVTNKYVQWALSRFSPTGDYSTTPVLEKKSSNVLQIAKIDPTNGVVHVFLIPADTLALFGDFYFELEVLASPGGEGVVVATGTLTINRNVANT